MNPTLLGVLALILLFILAYEYLGLRFYKNMTEGHNESLSHFKQANEHLLHELKESQRVALALASDFGEDDDEPQAAELPPNDAGSLAITPDDLAKIDAARGAQSRTAFIQEAIAAHLQRTFLVGRGGDS